MFSVCFYFCSKYPSRLEPDQRLLCTCWLPVKLDQFKTAVLNEIRPITHFIFANEQFAFGLLLFLKPLGVHSLLGARILVFQLLSCLFTSLQILFQLLQLFRLFDSRIFTITNLECSKRRFTQRSDAAQSSE